MKTVDFNVELAKKIAKGEIKGLIKTIDNRDVKILHWFAEGDFPIIGLIDNNIVKKYGKYGNPNDKNINTDLVIELLDFPNYQKGDILYSDKINSLIIFKSDGDGGYINTICSYNNNNQIEYDLKVRYDSGWRKADEKEIAKLFVLLSDENLSYDLDKQEIKTLDYFLKPFEKVICGIQNNNIWTADIYSHKLSKESEYKYICIGGMWNICIPYNEYTNSLIGTNE